jgi:predicted CoA-binding protein
MKIDDAVKAFLDKKRIAVAGVSHGGDSPANAIANRLRETGHEVFPVNPAGDVIDGHACVKRLEDIAGGVEAVVVVTRPEDAIGLARDAARVGAEWIWFHQGFGPVSYDDGVIEEARKAGLKVIAAGCPMMYCCPDGFHRCARAVFRAFGRIPSEIDVPS